MKFEHNGTKIPTSPHYKDPNDIADWGCDWTLWLSEGEIITSSSWVVPNGLVAVSDSNTNTTTNVFLSGGSSGTAYIVTNRITTNQSRSEDRSMRILCQTK